MYATVSESTHENSYCRLIPNPTLVDHVCTISIEGYAELSLKIFQHRNENFNVLKLSLSECR